jgi:TonB family protein
MIHGRKQYSGQVFRNIECNFSTLQGAIGSKLINFRLFSNSLLVFSSIILISCSSSLVNKPSIYDYAGCTTPSCINKGLLDTTIIDTADFQKRYAEFISGVDTISRSTQKVNVLLSRIKPDLIAGLISRIPLDTTKPKYHFCIAPDGSFDIVPFRYPSQIDTTVLKKLTAKISKENSTFPQTHGLWISRGIEVRNGDLFFDSANVYSNGKGGRSKASIMEVVMRNLSKMRYAYNRRLVASRGLRGKITVKFAINYLGSVIYCKVIDSTVGDELLETVINDQVASWKFEPIMKKGDVTEVVYPFVFSQ